MLNQVILVGRLVNQPEVVGELKESEVILAIPRTFKNGDGEYDTDFIPVSLPANIASNTAEYCKKGDIVGIKGRLQGNENVFYIIAEKVTFLSSKKE